MVIGQAKALKEGVKAEPINVDIMLDILKKQQDHIFEVQRYRFRCTRPTSIPFWTHYRAPKRNYKVTSVTYPTNSS